MKRFLLFLFAFTIFNSTIVSADDMADSGMMLFFDQDQLVETATRDAKPLSQTAEDVVIIDRDQIAAMNAHNLNEILRRVAGLFVGFSGHDYGGYASLEINGSVNNHTLLLVDSIPFNSLAGGNPDAMIIPVEIIKRVEVIRGPASSAWGSSLGGVINVITREPAARRFPEIEGYYSSGERDSSDSRLTGTGGTGPVGYFLYAGEQKSDGLRKDRVYKNDSLFGKFVLSRSDSSSLTLSGGYSDPSYVYGNLPYAALYSNGQVRASWYRLAFEHDIGGNFSISTAAWRLNNKYVQNNMENGVYGPFGALFKNLLYDEKSTGVDSRLVAKFGRHTVVGGIDFSRGELNQMVAAGAYYGSPPAQSAFPRIERRAFYLNDTVVAGVLSFTPGIRFDQNSVTTEDVFSPSIGLTWRLGRQTLARFSVARGHADPGLVNTSGGGLFFDPNPELEVEKVWSYQAGIEGRAGGLFWYKVGLFRHEIKDVFREVPSAVTSGNSMTVNRDHERRAGVTVEFETPAFHDISLRGGGTMVHVQKYDGNYNPDPYQGIMTIRYDNQRLALDLTGVYTWWDLDPTKGNKGSYDDILWDLNLRRQLPLPEKAAISGDFFATVHNLFNGHSYTNTDYPDPRRWIEAGLRLRF